jgi:uncharacterized protein YbaA (DUF1428 family)
MSAQGYIDLYLLPVLEQSIDPYREQATAFGVVTLEHGALSYREFRADDLGEGWTVPDGHLLAAGVVEFTSREHRDEVMGKVMADPRVTSMMEAEPLADMSQMRYGGFATFVQP